MGKLLRVFAILAIAGVVMVMGTGVVLAVAVASAGMMTVEVHDRSEGVDLYVPVPAALVNVGLGTARLWMPEREMAQVRRELDPYAPSLRAVAEALEQCPDAKLVEVVTDSERVRVEKRGRSYTVNVQSDDADVKVSLPAATLSRVLNAFDV